jgi:hypothetical protein
MLGFYEEGNPLHLREVSFTEVACFFALPHRIEADQESWDSMDEPYVPDNGLYASTSTTPTNDKPNYAGMEKAIEMVANGGGPDASSFA